MFSKQDKSIQSNAMSTSTVKWKVLIDPIVEAIKTLADNKGKLDSDHSPLAVAKRTYLNNLLIAMDSAIKNFYSKQQQNDEIETKQIFVLLVELHKKIAQISFADMNAMVRFRDTPSRKFGSLINWASMGAGATAGFYLTGPLGVIPMIFVGRFFGGQTKKAIGLAEELPQSANSLFILQKRICESIISCQKLLNCEYLMLGSAMKTKIQENLNTSSMEGEVIYITTNPSDNTICAKYRDNKNQINKIEIKQFLEIKDAEILQNLYKFPSTEQEAKVKAICFVLIFRYFQSLLDKQLQLKETSTPEVDTPVTQPK